MAQLSSLNFLSAEELQLLDVALVKLADSNEKYWNDPNLWALLGKVVSVIDQQR